MKKKTIFLDFLGFSDFLTIFDFFWVIFFCSISPSFFQHNLIYLSSFLKHYALFVLPHYPQTYWLSLTFPVAVSENMSHKILWKSTGQKRGNWKKWDIFFLSSFFLSVHVYFFLQRFQAWLVAHCSILLLSTRLGQLTLLWIFCCSCIWSKTDMFFKCLRLSC